MRKLLSFLLFLALLDTQAQQVYTIHFTHDGKTVNGTFTTPNGSKKFKTIIVNGGSGANDRYGTLPMEGANIMCLYPGLLGDTLRPYQGLSDALVKAGYAVLIYDKLEYTYTTPSALGAITFHKIYLPVESAIGYVKTRNDVDTHNIILLGHSEGSSLIPFIARSRKDIKALISVAGPRTPFDSILAYQIVSMTQKCGGDVSQAQSQANQILAYFNTIRTNSWNGSTPALFGLPASAWYDYVRATDSVSSNYNRCHLPTLFLNFKKDINVPPAELTRFKNEVTITNDFWSIDSLIHYMCTENTPRVSKVLTDTIIYWLRDNGFPSSVHSISSNALSVWPNPAGNELHIALPDQAAENVVITITDPSGKIIAREISHQAGNSITSILDISDLAPGLYFVHLNSGDLEISKMFYKN